MHGRQGFDRGFHLQLADWTHGRDGRRVSSAGVFGSQLQELSEKHEEPGENLETEMERVRATYEKELDAKYAAARGLVDAVIAPEDTRPVLELALRVSLNY